MSSTERPAPQHVLVTGAAGAIGGAIARRLRAMWPSTRLALLDRDADATTALAAELGNASSHGADLREIATLPDVIARIEGRTNDSPSAPGASSMPRSAATPGASSMGASSTGAASTGASTPGASSPGASTMSASSTDSSSVRSSTPATADRPLPLDGLVNCAGVMWVRHVATWDWSDAETLLAIDFLAPLRLQDLVVHSLVERGAPGVVVNIASMAGKVPLKGCTYYGASKAGLAMASEIARADLAPHGIRVVTVYPGPVTSPLEQGARDAYGGGGFFGKFAPVGDPDELARLIGRAIEDDEPRVIYPRMYRVGWSAPSTASWFALAFGPPPVS